MTEPDVASSDATNIELRVVRHGEDYVLDGRKWFASNALHRNCAVLIVQHVAPASTDLKVAQRVSDFAARMGITTIATGIESEEQLGLLRGMGVAGYQGS